MTVKTESSAAAFSDATCPRQHNDGRNCLQKLHLSRVRTTKRDHRGPGNFLKDQRLASPKGNEL